MNGTVVITGASSGIGEITAHELASRGARIVMVVRNRDKGQRVIDEIVRKHPEAQLELAIADLYSLAEVRRVGAELRARFPKIDVLVNNAGLIHDKRELTVDGFERTFALNHLAAFQLTYELREPLAAAAPSRIVTVASGGHKFAHIEWDDLATATRWRPATVVYGSSATSGSRAKLHAASPRWESRRIRCIRALSRRRLARAGRSCFASAPRSPSRSC
jgi:NAD(P)-dependent dehydrogenase (short-subunit alcohol dehydrogenase family)